jgi:hypothetical protein
MYMLKLLKIIGYTALVLFLLSITFHLLKPDPWISLTTKKNQIRYSGKISFEGYEKLIKVYEEAKRKPTTLKITSGGGSGLAGILIGRFVKDKGLDVQVSRHCVSSCANYVFPAGMQKSLHHDSLVIYHGGMFQKNLLSKMLASHQSYMSGDSDKDNNKSKEASLLSYSELETKLEHKYFPDKGACKKPLGDTEAIVESARRCLQFSQNIEREFFALLNVDPKLPYYGQEGSYKVVYQAYKHIGFYYDLESLKQMGLSNVEVIGEAWKPSENNKFENVYKVTLRGSRVSLEHITDPP